MKVENHGRSRVSSVYSKEYMLVSGSFYNVLFFFSILIILQKKGRKGGNKLSSRKNMKLFHQFGISTGGVVKGY